MSKKEIKSLKRHFFFKVILQFFLKKGNLKTAEENVKLLFETLFLKTGLGDYSIISKIYKTLYINFEIKSIKKRKNFHIVPMPIRKKRRFFIITKWIFQTISNDKQRKPAVHKLSTEILKYLENQPSESLIKKNLSETTALQHRSNIHFRWY
jgi:ribosomal protein S7